ncbi:hypothetical protein BDQ17DRAFT_879233 [Cyathus striatus]|nr:hypothetical protein BDQ17DRAFT_879233 [Cyathus striatus]
MYSDKTPQHIPVTPPRSRGFGGITVTRTPLKHSPLHVNPIQPQYPYHTQSTQPTHLSHTPTNGPSHSFDQAELEKIFYFVFNGEPYGIRELPPIKLQSLMDYRWGVNDQRGSALPASSFEDKLSPLDVSEPFWTVFQRVLPNLSAEQRAELDMLSGIHPHAELFFVALQDMVAKLYPSRR